MESFKLEDGSTLFVNQKGEMKMVDNHGNGVPMKDGVTMETEDGRVIMMKNHALWERTQRGTPNPKITP